MVTVCQRPTMVASLLLDLEWKRVWTGTRSITLDIGPLRNDLVNAGLVGNM